MAKPDLRPLVNYSLITVSSLAFVTQIQICCELGKLFKWLYVGKHEKDNFMIKGFEPALHLEQQ
jgi:hypothetical protein